MPVSCKFLSDKQFRQWHGPEEELSQKCHDYQRQMNGCLIRCLRTQRRDLMMSSRLEPPDLLAPSSKLGPASGPYEQASFHMSHKRLVVVQFVHAIRNSS